MKQNSILENSIWIISCRVIQALTSMVVSMLTARYLGPSNYGLINYVASLVAFVAPFMKMGFNHILVNELSKEPEHEGEILGTVIGSCVLSSIACIVGIVSFVYFVNAGEEITIVVCALYGLNLFAQALEMIQYWFQMKMMSQYISITGLVAYMIVSIYKVYLLIARKSIYWFAISQTLDYLIISIVLLCIYYKFTHHKLKFSLSRFTKMFARSKYFIISSLMITVFAQTDKIMLKSWLTEESVGIYSAAIVCAGMGSFVFGAIIDSFRPIIFEKKNTSRILYESEIVSCYSVIMYLSIAYSVFCTIFSKHIISILYGSDYIESAKVLGLVVWYTTFSYMGSIRDIWMLAESKQKYLWIINMSGAITNVVLNMVLIPIYGVMGAAVASLITQVFTNFIVGFIIRPIRYNNKLMLKACNPNIIIKQIKSIAKIKRRGNTNV